MRKRPGMYIGSTGPRGLHHLVITLNMNHVCEGGECISLSGSSIDCHIIGYCLSTSTMTLEWSNVF